MQDHEVTQKELHHYLMRIFMVHNNEVIKQPISQCWIGCLM